MPEPARNDQPSTRSGAAKDTRVSEDPRDSVAPPGSNARDLPTTVRGIWPGKQPSELAVRPVVPGYKILAELGRGNMGVVYKARQLSLGRLVALKMIRTGAQAGPDELKRFLDEARVIASLQHPHIIQIYEIGMGGEAPYFSMELVEGGNLAEHLAGRPQPWRQAAELIQTLALTIHVAHQNGIIHRDLKPANILMQKSEGRGVKGEKTASTASSLVPGPAPLLPKITDFGLAKQLQDKGSQTASGIIMGTPNYMAPEQAEGRSRDVGPAADIYALGAILYEILTGRPPYHAESPAETVLQMFRIEPVPPSRLQPRVPRDLETICLKCLQKDPRRRYASAQDLAEDLQHCLAGEPIAARPASVVEKCWKSARRHPALATLVGCAVVALLALAGMAVAYQANLETQLDQALHDERQARTAEEGARRRVRMEGLQVGVAELLATGERAALARDWSEAQTQLLRARDRAGSEQELAGLRARIESRLTQARRGLADRTRYQQFQRKRDEALLHATLLTDSDLASGLREARTAAVAALALFGVETDAGGRVSLDGVALEKREQAEVVAGCYELLLVVADTLAHPLPGQPQLKGRLQARRALAVLDRAARLGISTRAFHVRYAHYLKQAEAPFPAWCSRALAEAQVPTSSLDHFLTGVERYRRGDCKSAAADFERALQMQPDHFWAQYYLALCWLQARRPDLAATGFTACVGRRPDFAWLYLLRGSARCELGQFNGAAADFERAVRLPLNTAARYGLYVNRGVLNVRRKQFDRAAADLSQAVALQPTRYQAHVNLAQVLALQGKLDDAVRALDRAIEHAPLLAALYRTRARLQLHRKNVSAALHDLDQAIRLEVDRKSADLADDLVERARLLSGQNRSKDAVQACDEALKAHPGLAAAHRVRAEALLDLNRVPEALTALDACMAQGQPQAELYRVRAAARARLGKYAAALADYGRALEREQNAVTYAARGWIYVVTGAPRLGLPDFEEALRLDPDCADAHAGRGYVRVNTGAYVQGLADVEKALQLGPETTRLLYGAARAYAQAVRKLDEATAARLTSYDANLRRDYQNRAARLLARAVAHMPAAECAAFWQRYVQTDFALFPLRGNALFRELAETYCAKR